MKGYHLVDLSLPLMNGGGFGMPAESVDIRFHSAGMVRLVAAAGMIAR